MLRNLLFLLFGLLSFNLFAQSIWLPVPEQGIPAHGERRIVPAQYRTFQLTLAALQPVLVSAPERFTPQAEENYTELALPSPDGGMVRFRLFESPVMAPALQAKYPEIRCYTGVGIEDARLRLKCDLTPWGFHAMVLGDASGSWFIDPYSHGDTEHYVSYYKKDYQAKEEPFACLTEADGTEIKPGQQSDLPDFVGDCRLRTYRLALACTGEYANFHGGTVPLVLAAMNTTMNRVNGVYENDLTVTMQIIANNDLLVYLNGSTDPYNNGNGSTMLNQNVNNINAVIGLANYDIGHVFSTGGGGIAGLGVVCTNGKARGVTGGGSPVGDPFDIDYVAHEMGHQFGANHTQNNNCNRVGTASMEPGSASTIMGYAGICSPNVQSNSDDYFHAISLQEMGAFVTSGSGNVCPVKTTTGNNAPVVSAGADYVIPKSTPFVLTATAQDADSDSLSYCWEQMDPQFANMPPVSTSTGGPLFRSYKATPSPARYFPRLPDLVNNVNSTWEELPGVARTMNFRVTVRDNHAGAGCTDEDNAVITVAGSAGPFVVTEPNTNVLWTVGETRTVTWNVAGTDAAPVNCSHVRILLSTDGGFSYPVVLADSVPNSGSVDITVPLQISNTCRVMVAGRGNIFFDISNQNFRIELPPVPTFLLSASLSDAVLCAGDTLRFTADAESILGFADTISFSLDGAPAGANVFLSPGSLTPNGTVDVEISGLTSDMAGNYILTLTADADSVVRTADIALTLFPGAPNTPIMPVSPIDSALGINSLTVLNWQAVQYAEQYVVQLASSPSFEQGTLILDQFLADTSVSVSGLAFAGVYYWRVWPFNSCGAGDPSPTLAFQVGDTECGFSYSSTDVPVAISTSTTATVFSKITVPEDRNVADVVVNMQAAHTWVGDLAVRLLGPGGLRVQLFDQPGVPEDQFGCDGDNLDLQFSDAAAQTAVDLENLCNNSTPALSGTFQPINLLSAFDGQNAQGDWILEVRDNYDGDGGALNAWSLDLCYVVSTPPTVLLINEPMDVPKAGERAISINYLSGSLSGSPAQGRFTLLSVPAYGTLLVGGLPLGIGGTFTQEDIDNGIVVYTHNGDAAPQDFFRFDYLDANNGGWLHNAVFLMNVRENTLVLGADVTQPVACTGESNGQITATVSGGYPPMTFTINSGGPQDSSVFNNLLAGAYTVVVTDILGFTAETNIVDLPDPAALTLAPVVNADMVNANANGGTGMLEYSLDGQNFQPDPIFTGVPDGFYTLVVRDVNGCTSAEDIIVAANQLLAAVNVTSPANCFGGNEGALSVIPAGGMPPYAYSLDGIDFQNDSIFTGLTAGIYSVIVKDDSGATTTAGPVVITEPPAIVADAGVNLNRIVASAIGGTGVLEYSLDGVNFQADNTFENLPNGDYTVTVRDANGCTATVPVTVAVPALAIVNISSTEILCAGETASVTISATGGIPPYAYSLDNGSFQPDPSFANVGGGAHTIVIRDAFGTEISEDILLVEPSALSTDIVISGNDITAITVDGGTPPYSLTYGPGLPQDLMNIPNGSYAVTATDANGCTLITSFMIDYTVVSAEAAGVDPLCAGDANGSVTVNAQNGTPPYQYSIDGVNYQQDNVFDGLAAGDYTLTVQDALGDTYEVQITLLDPVALNADAQVTADSITVIAGGGTGALEYSLDGQVYQSSDIFLQVANGTYDIRVRDVNGCQFIIENVVVNYVSTVDPVSAWGLHVMPNPSSGLFRIRLDQAPARDIQATVVDVTGRVLQSLHWSPSGVSFQTDIDLRELPQGLYILQLNDGINTGAVRLQVVR